MTQKREVYQCSVCGAIVEVIQGGAGRLHCCGQPMKRMEENTVEASIEKHMPQVSTSGLTYRVVVGSQPHPMTADHYIQWIEMETPSGVHHTCLPPGSLPQALFHTHEVPIAFRAYCNLHGLWKLDYAPKI